MTLAATAARLAEQAKAAASAFISPLLGVFPITTQYGAPSAFDRTPHLGIDFGTPEGTPIYAPADMKITRADARDPGGGNIIIGQYGDIELVFAHLSSFAANVGDTVQQGEIIGYTGSSGHVTGAHLHFEAKRNGVPFNPLNLFDAFHAPDAGAYQKGKDKPTKTKEGETDLLGALGDIVRFILNPENWARVLAVFGGAILVLIGLYILWSAT